MLEIKRPKFYLPNFFASSVAFHMVNIFHLHYNVNIVG